MTLAFIGIGANLGDARQAIKDAIVCLAQQVGITDGARLPGQHEEDGLEGVLGVVAVAQELAADVQDHGPVPPDKDLK